MKNFETLKDIWHGQTELPKAGYNDILKKIKQTRNRFANKLLFQVLSLIAAIAALVFILFNNDFDFNSSKIGISIFIVCIAYYLGVQLIDYRRINRSGMLLDKPDEYISYLKSYKHHRYVLNTRIYRIYMFFIAFGLALGFIEVFFTISIWQTVLAVIFTVAWFVICNYVFMKLYIRKEETRLNDMIRNLERLQKQFSANE